MFQGSFCDVVGESEGLPIPEDAGDLLDEVPPVKYINLALMAGFGGGPSGKDPLVLDLNGDGLQLTRRDDANIYFDVDHEGFAERTAPDSPRCRTFKAESETRRREGTAQIGQFCVDFAHSGSNGVETWAMISDLVRTPKILGASFFAGPSQAIACGLDQCPLCLGSDQIPRRTEMSRLPTTEIQTLAEIVFSSMPLRSFPSIRPWHRVSEVFVLRRNP